MKKYLTLTFFLCVSLGVFSQKIIDINIYDTFRIKKVIYLIIRTDQLISGARVEKFENIDVSDSVLNTIILNDVSVVGMPEELIFTEIIVNTHNEKISYLLCYNTQFQQFYRLTGFYENQYMYLFDYLKKRGVNLNNQLVKKKKLYIKGLDFACLLNIYKDVENKIIGKISFTDRLKYPCLNYNFQPILIR